MAAHAIPIRRHAHMCVSVLADLLELIVERVKINFNSFYKESFSKKAKFVLIINCWRDISKNFKQNPATRIWHFLNRKRKRDRQISRITKFSFYNVWKNLREFLLMRVARLMAIGKVIIRILKGIEEQHKF